MSVIESAVEEYLKTYRDLIVSETVDGSAVISFPFHLAANHRIEITVTDIGGERCVLSDAARTLGEITAAGFSLTAAMTEKLERLAGTSGLRIVSGHLILESPYGELGASIQRFLEVSKTVGDVYLIHRQREETDNELLSQVTTTLNSDGILYRTNERIDGQIEKHAFDVVIPPNGAPGMAVSILAGQNTHNVAQIWGFKCDDIRRSEFNRKLRLALIYDTRYHRWSDASKSILESRADVAIPSDSINDLPDRFRSFSH